MEFEPGGVADLRALLDRLVPVAGDYEHNRLNHDTNSHAHQRASLIGASEQVPVIGGRLALGTWQQLVLIDFDDRPRDRTVVVQIVSWRLRPELPPGDPDPRGEGEAARDDQQRDVDRESAAPPAWSKSPRPSATPSSADAGIVVTEIATPTAAAARVSKESIAATPAARAISTVE